MKTRSVLIGLAAVAMFSVPAVAQVEVECNCLFECPAGEVKEAITNIKKPDLAIVDQNQTLGNKILSKNSNTVVVKVMGVQEAIEAISDEFTRRGRKLNVVVDGHGFPGHQRFGKEDMGHSTEETRARQVKFERAVKGKIKHLTLFGCETAKDDVGQAFILKLKEAIQADRVTAWSGVIEKQQGRSEAPSQGFFIKGGGQKKVATPALPKWGLIALVVVLGAGGAVVFGRRRGTRVGFGG